MKPFDPRLLRYARAAGGYLVAGAVTALVQAIAIVAFAWGAGSVIAAAVQGETATLAPTAAVASAAIIVRGLCSWVDAVLAARAAAKVRTQLRERALAALGDHDVASSSSDVAATLGNGLDALDGYFGEFLPQLVRTIVVTPVILLALLVTDTFTGVAVIICLPLIPLFMVLIGMATEKAQDRQWDATKHLAGRFLEILEGTATLKLFGRDRRAAETIRAASDEHRIRTNQVLRISFISSMVLELAASLSIALVAVSIGVRLIDGEIALAIAFGVLILTPDAFLPIRMVGGAFHASTEGVAAIRDCLDIAEAPAAAVVGFPAGVPDATGGLQVACVTDARLHLPPLTFSAAAGTLTVITGPSGAGKSTATKALAGLAPATGEATLDGAPLTRADIAFMQQGSWDAVITASLRENLLLGGTASDAQLRELLGTLEIDVDLDTRLKPARGGALGVSGGQAQRIALARALLRIKHGARVLIADEPTSALDAETERLVTAALRSAASEGAIVIAVSHRPTLMDAADSVVTLEGAMA